MSVPAVFSPPCKTNAGIREIQTQGLIWLKVADLPYPKRHINPITAETCTQIDKITGKYENIA